jgi:phage regulator Rha-like protein
MAYMLARADLLVLCQALLRIQRIVDLDRAPLPANVQARHQFRGHFPKNQVVAIAVTLNHEPILKFKFGLVTSFDRLRTNEFFRSS